MRPSLQARATFAKVVTTHPARVILLKKCKGTDNLNLISLISRVLASKQR